MLVTSLIPVYRGLSGGLDRVLVDPLGVAAAVLSFCLTLLATYHYRSK
jgi:hypothetical protein